MRGTDNKALMQEIFRRLAEGDGALLFDSMAEDFRWIIGGTTSWSRSYDGKQAVLDELIVPLRARMAGRMKTVAHRFIAADDYVVVEARGHNRTRAGKPYNNAYCYVVRLRDGKLSELTEYLDTELVTAALGDRTA
ncbi:MAG: nuclear transport factor 2 family protein [Xanthobacteraceae bacterium]|jgi:ketosteroid isomerase-like protein